MTTSYELLLRAAAELELRRRQAAQQPFGAWLREVSPDMTWDAPHLVHIRTQLARVTRGEIDRLMLFVPPRHGKSEMATVRYPVWRMERDPTLTVIVGAYNKALADNFSRKSRRIARERFAIDDERKAADEWQTPQGGVFRAAGVGTGVTGKGAKLVVIDDPVKSREEANSPAYRERVWNWYRDDLYTRLEPGGAIILIMTRWHEDDLAGRILASEDAASWTVVNLPAEAEAGDPLGREPGAALWPGRFDVDDLARIRRVLGTALYTALYQQRPTPAEGDFFRRDWFRIVHALAEGSRLARYWDKAGSPGKGDWTAGVLMARTAQGRFVVVDVVRGQWSAGERERMIRQTAELDAQRFGHVAIWLEQEPGSGGKESAEASVRNLAGFTARAEPVTGDKATRAMPLAAQAEVGNVDVLAGPWNAAFLEELAAFPNGAHDDQVDAASGAFNKLAISDQMQVVAQGARLFGSREQQARGTVYGTRR